MSDVVRPNNHISAIMKEYVEELEFKYQNPGKLCGIPTGYDCRSDDYRRSTGDGKNSSGHQFNL